MDDGRKLDGLSGGCHMCLAIPGKIIEISAENPDTAIVDVVSVRRKVDLGLLQDDRPQPGDWVRIHVGFAMSKISEQDAMTRCKLCASWEKHRPSCRKLRAMVCRIAVM